MKSITVKDVVFQSGRTNICTSLCGTTVEELQEECALLTSDVDVVEWRMDFFHGTEIEDWLQALQKLKEHHAISCLLATWRSSREGGKKQATLEFYTALNQAMIQSGMIDLIDIELFAGEATVNTLVQSAHDNKVAVILSNHDMNQTPSKEAMLIRLKAMQSMGADLVKLAVMPRNKQDVINLVEITTRYCEAEDACPCITMSMGALGSITRVIQSFSGSVMSFASLRQCSAPGQLSIPCLASLFQLLNEQSS